MTIRLRNKWHSLRRIVRLCMVSSFVLGISGWAQTRAETPMQHFIYANSVLGRAATPIKLRIWAPASVGEEGIMVLLSGVPAGARFNAGIYVGPGEWLLDTAHLQDVTVTVPDGIFLLKARLLTEDLRDASQAMFFTVTAIEGDGAQRQ